MNDPDEDMIIALDVVSGEVFLTLHGHPLFFSDVDAFVELIDYLYAAVPRLRAAAEASGGCDKTEPPRRPRWELQNWSVVVKEHHSDIGDEEQVERIAAATGWSRAKTDKAVRKGFPVVLGFNLTLIEALNLQQAAELNGVTANISAASQ